MILEIPLKSEGEVLEVDTTELMNLDTAETIMNILTTEQSKTSLFLEFAVFRINLIREYEREKSWVGFLLNSTINRRFRIIDLFFSLNSTREVSLIHLSRHCKQA